MNGYVQGILYCYHLAPPKKTHLSYKKYTDISYGSKVQYAAEYDSNPPLDALGIKRVQGIVGYQLYYARAVDNKIFVALITIGSQQPSATKRTLAAIYQLLDYVVTYPNDSIAYRASIMVLAGHSDASFLDESKLIS